LPGALASLFSRALDVSSALETPVLSRELAVACAAARAGGRAAMRHYGSATAQLKEGGSPVTLADHAANAAILAVLRAEFPDDAVLSEETTDSPGRLAADRVWIVDPLDGTKEFLAQNGEFSIMVGLSIHGRAVAGAVYAPATGLLLYGAEGTGAWRQEDGAEAEPLRAPSARADALRFVGSRSHPDPLVVAIQEALGVAQVRPSGSVGVKCGLIALGECDVYVHPVPYLKEWDTCAPEVVLREAGGDVTDCTGEPLRYNKPDPRQPRGIVACAPGVFAPVLATVQPLWRRDGAEG
jgi:3'(2'), 5'-bisphosphate nucleotidase